MTLAAEDRHCKEHDRRMPSLVLVRHGPSAHVHAGALDRDGVEQWRASYDATGIRLGDRPPEALVALAAATTYIVASDLPRAIESAERLAPKRPITVSPLVREAPLPIPQWPTRLPLMAWNSIITVRWYYHRLRRTDLDGPDWARAERAASWLNGVLTDGTSAMIITHGVFRRLLGLQLVRSGWSLASRQGGYRHWSSWHFSFQGDRVPPSSPNV
jgi:broad specificity phosphatase PhoE